MINTIEESCCSYLLSKLLEEKGFDNICNNYYVEKYLGSTPYLSVNIPHDCFDYVVAPTHALAIEWLRINFGIWVFVRFDSWNTNTFSWEVIQKD